MDKIEMARHPWDDEALSSGYSRFDDALRFGRLAARRIYLDTSIDGETGRTFRALTDAMLGASTTAEITVIINSPGGSVVEGFDIISQIRVLQRAGIEVRGHVQGDAASMAAVILAACSTRTATSLSRLMWHGIQSWSVGDMTDMRDQQRETQRMSDKLAAILTATAKPGTRFANKSWVKRVMGDKRPVWIYPDEALAAGLVDEVVD
jgi:ATP-dependent protease ClpP protease subunit